MTDFEMVLEVSLQQLLSGSRSLNEILAHYPQYAAELKPLLQTAGYLKQGRGVKPSPATRARTRTRLNQYLKAHPRGETRRNFPVWRVAGGFAVLMLALLTTGTAFAQSALPGDPFYGWKLSSEKVWRSLAPDPVSVDLTVADRRVHEMKSLTSDLGEGKLALAGYLDVLGRLQSESNGSNHAQILRSLKAQQSDLSQSSISIGNLDEWISQSPAGLPANPPKNPLPAVPKPVSTP